MKIAILMYGLFRSPLTPLFWKNAFPKGCDIFLFSTFTSSPFTPRSGDVPLLSNNTFPGIAAAKVWSVVDQTRFDADIGIDTLVKRRIDPFHTKGKSSLRNAVRALYQMEKLADLFLLHNKTGAFTHVVLTRVDLLFTRRMTNTSVFEKNVVVPSYADNGGVNDRFLAGPANEVVSLMRRVSDWKQSGLVAEKLLQYVARRRGIVLHRKRVGLNRRVRGDGSLHACQYDPEQGCKYDSATNILEVRDHLPLTWC